MAFGGHGPMPIRLGGTDEDGWSASQHARLCADLVAVKRVLPMARVQVNQPTFGTGSIVAYTGQNGNGLGYAPTLTEHSLGDITLTWPVYWTDDYDVQYPIHIRHAVASYCATSGVVSGSLCTVEITGARSVRVRSFFQNGLLIYGRFSLRVWS